MKQIAVGEAEAGMVLGQPIIDSKGRTIVKAGARLTQLYISRLDRWGVKELWIEEKGDLPRDTGSGELKLEEVAAPGKGGAGAAGPARPPGVYCGEDLEERIDRTFSGVLDDPLMAAMREVVRHCLLPQGAKD